jgi:SAM-dependent methyltransferase
VGDAHTRAVQNHHNRTAELWRGIYSSPTFHDHVIQERMRRALHIIDSLPLTQSSEQMIVLDAGCGAGQLLTELAARGFVARGFDNASRMVETTKELLQREGLRADVIQADGARLPYPDSMFDLVVGLGYVEYFAEPEVALQELVRVAKPGAFLIITSPNPLRLTYLLDPVGVVCGYFFPKQGYRRRYHSVFSLRRLLRRTGLAPMRIEGHGLGQISLAGRPLFSDDRSLRIDRLLDRVLPMPAKRLLGANLIAVGHARTSADTTGPPRVGGPEPR